ncbi:MAG TPA: hypothetical protein VME86_16350 [Acidobacteriaceae bacterium]|nr:hypothetical protein [Acidobacteriaceae bacterium]
MQFASLPFGYMIVVRLRTRFRVVSFFLTEWIPLALALKLAYRASFWLTILMLAGNFTAYECGHFFNDLADSAIDVNGDHLEGRKIGVAGFILSHFLVFIVVVAVVFYAKGPRFALTYATLSVLVLLAFLWHTTRWPRSFRFLRLFSFAFLYLYKFAPVIVPQVPITDALWILAGMFFCWGFWRVLFYTMVKFGGPLTASGDDFDPLRLLHLTSLVIGAPLLLSGWFSTPRNIATTVLWFVYAAIAILRTGTQLTNWRLTPEQFLGKGPKRAGG